MPVANVWAPAGKSVFLSVHQIQIHIADTRTSTDGRCRAPCDPVIYKQPLMRHTRGGGKSPQLPRHRRGLPSEASYSPSVNQLYSRSRRCSEKGELILRSNNPPFLCTEIRVLPSATARFGFLSGAATTASSSPRCRVILDEQEPQSQKYSTRLDSPERTAPSPSRRKSLPPCR